jgi:hypothetical protein
MKPYLKRNIQTLSFKIATAVVTFVLSLYILAVLTPEVFQRNETKFDRRLFEFFDQRVPNKLIL